MVKDLFWKSDENMKCSATFILIVRFGIFHFEPNRAEQLGVEICKLYIPVKTFLCHSGQISQMIYVVQNVYFYVKYVKLAQICAKLVKIWIP